MPDGFAAAPGLGRRPRRRRRGMMDELETWREMLDGVHLIAVAPDESVLDVPFDAGYGGTEGPDFLAWSETHVYFPVCYDGAESVGSAPRNPTSKGQSHVGGG